MLTLTVSSDQPESEVIATAVQLLRAGGVVAYPTDTLYGLAVDPRLDEAVEKLFDVKGRAERQAIPLIAASLDQVLMAGELGETELRLAREFWPGPLTIVVPARPGVSARILAGGRTLAIRVPAHPIARALAAGLGSPITSTSANLSGTAAPASPRELDPAITATIDAVIDSGSAPGGLPSTIVSMTAGGLQLVRAGAIAWDRVLRSAEEP
jgi:L-threonylcarbamoyladenylate synthase